MLQEPTRSLSAAELETSKQCILNLKGERLSPHQKALATTVAVRKARGSQVLWSQAITDRISDTASAITITAASANTTATSAEATTTPAEDTAAKQLEVQQHQQLNDTHQTSVAATGASTETEVDQLRRQLLVSWQSQVAVEARLAACEAQNSELQRQLELRQKSQTAAADAATALVGNVNQLQRQLKAAKTKEAAAETRAAAAEHSLLQLKSVSQMVLDLREVPSSSSVLVDALAHGVAALRFIN